MSSSSGPSRLSALPSALRRVGLLLLAIAFSWAAAPAPALAQAAVMPVDINPEVPPAMSSSLPMNLFSALGKVFFTAWAPETGRELWVSDGTPNGTLLLRDVCPGACSAEPELGAVLDGVVLFSAVQEETACPALWRTDGTPEGTRALGGGSPAYGTPQDLAAFAGELYFFAGTASGGLGLWKANAAHDEPGPERLCLNGGRFAVEAAWKDFAGNTGAGRAVPLFGGDTGYFWFFNEDNVEVMLKVLDGRPVNGKFWVFYGALSSVEYVLKVTDVQTGATRTYRNPAGRLASVADTGAF